VSEARIWLLAGIACLEWAPWLGGLNIGVCMAIDGALLIVTGIFVALL
jgi:hypothetical protein